MRYAICAAMALICITLPAQTSPATPQFEVASVRPAAPEARSVRYCGSSVETTGGPARFRWKVQTLSGSIIGHYSI